MLNERNLPVARIHSDGFALLNPEILTWERVDHSKEIGRALVWIDEDRPLRSLDPDSFAVRLTWGEVRVTVARTYLGMLPGHSQKGDKLRWQLEGC